MPVYEYQAIAKSGKSTKGVIDADSLVNARRKLREQDMYPTELTEQFAKETKGGPSGTFGGGGSRIKLKDITLMTRQLAVLLQAGMPLVEGLSALLDQTPNARLTKIIYDVRDKVNSGMRLADALNAHVKVFGDLYIGLVKAGEASGSLEQVLNRMAETLDRQTKLKQSVVSALAYPVVMAFVGVSVITFLMMVIVPKITAMFTRQKRDLPWITEALVATCDFMGAYWYAIVITFFALISLWRLWVARPEGRRSWDKLKLRTPFVGRLYLQVICANFARTLGTMLESGLTMMNALDVVRSVVQNRVIEEALDDVKAGVRRGMDLAIPLKQSGVFPPMLIHMTELGQRSGTMEAMLLKVAETYENEVEVTVDALVSILEPIMILVMGLFVGVLVMAILLPIFDMSRGVH
jgi:general secretion pathway protein F